MRIQNVIWLLGVTTGLIGCAAPAPPRGDTRSGSSAPVVFVCEHGAAKSVVAAAYFNRLAQEHHLPLRAVARGVTPQDQLSTSAMNGLRADGVTSDVTKPSALSREEAQSALRVVSFLPLPAGMTGERPPIEWDDVPATGDGYDIARDTIVEHVKVLFEELAKSRN